MLSKEREKLMEDFMKPLPAPPAGAPGWLVALDIGMQGIKDLFQAHSRAKQTKKEIELLEAQIKNTILGEKAKTISTLADVFQMQENMRRQKTYEDIARKQEERAGEKAEAMLPLDIESRELDIKLKKTQVAKEQKELEQPGTGKGLTKKQQQDVIWGGKTRQDLQAKVAKKGYAFEEATMTLEDKDVSNFYSNLQNLYHKDKLSDEALKIASRRAARLKIKMGKPELYKALDDKNNPNYEKAKKEENALYMGFLKHANLYRSELEEGGLVSIGKAEAKTTEKIPTIDNWTEAQVSKLKSGTKVYYQGKLRTIK